MDIFSKKHAQKLDAEDPLRHFREQFTLPDPDLIYLDGNSLGMLPRKTKPHLNNVLSHEWGEGLIRSWNTGWYERSQQVAAKIAPLIGARPHEVIMADSTSVNLFKLGWAALQHQRGRKGIVSDELNFPSDIYLLQGLVEMSGNQFELRLASSSDGMTVSTEEIKEKMGDDTALLTLSHVVFKSAFMYDMKAVTKLAHEKGTLVLWDLSHATGAVPVDLNGSNADLAVGCTYKYLNGGPGSPAFLYVREDLQEKLLSPIWGWFGQDNPFNFQLEYKPATGIERFLAGTPPMLSLSALDPSLDIFLEAGMERIREKSLQQTDYLIALTKKFLVPHGFTVASPKEGAHRGSHVSIRHKEAYRICKALIDKEIGNKVVIPDFREPDNIRLGIAPLYNTFEEIFGAVMELREIAEKKLYQKFSDERDAVT